MIRLLFIVLLYLSCCVLTLPAQVGNTERLNLTKAIEIATDSSLSAFRAKHLYLASYWQYRSFRANRLPSLFLNTNPLQYNRNFTKRYDSQGNIDVYKTQQNLSSSANLSLRQNVDFTGGTVFIDSDLGYLRSFGFDKVEQFSTIPIRVGYSQSLFGYNSFKWDKKLEPLQFEKAKKELIYNIEEISEITTEYFFNLVLSQKLFDIALQNVNSNDTLYQIGLERHKIGAISQADLLTLKLYKINAQNDLANAKIDLQRSSFLLATFLRLDANTVFELEMPDQIKVFSINIDDAIEETKKNNPKIAEIKEQLLLAQQGLDIAEKNSRFTASISASMGFNQVAGSFPQAYKKPLQQEMVSVGLSIPILDWGVRKGNVNMAKSNLNSVLISTKQSEIALEQEIIMSVNDFNTRINQIKSAEDALKVSEMAYEETKQRFLIGKSDVNSLNLSLNRQTEAQRNYIIAVKNYWQGYYKIRRLTLYDFVNKSSILLKFEEHSDFNF